jgi:hypothetical protein
LIFLALLAVNSEIIIRRINLRQRVYNLPCFLGTVINRLAA